MGMRIQGYQNKTIPSNTKPGEVSTYTMSPGELERYRNPDKNRFELQGAKPKVKRETVLQTPQEAKEWREKNLKGKKDKKL